MSATWMPVLGFEGIYEVSSAGQVRNVLPRQGTRAGRFLKPTVNKRGYKAISLRHPARSERRYVELHRVVAEAFLGPLPDGMQTRHLNGNPLDCRISNLAYGTRSENTYDRVRHGTHQFAKRSHCKYGHAYTEDNIYRDPSRPGTRLCRICKLARSHGGRPTPVAVSPATVEIAARWPDAA